MTRVLSAIAVLIALSCSGCADGVDAYDGPGMWRPEGANAGNLAAMVTRPADLVEGRADRTSLKIEAQDAVIRLWQNRVRPFPSAGSASAGATGSTPKDNN